MTRPYIWMPEDSQRMWEAAEQRVKAAAADPRRCDLSTLSDAEKRTLWDHLRQCHPDLAATLQDPHVQAIREQFDAHIMIEADRLPPGFRS